MPPPASRDTGIALGQDGSDWWRDLATLTFHLLTLNLVRKSHQRCGTFLPNLGTLDLWVFEVFATYSTDGRTDRRTDKSKAYCSFPTGRGIKNDTQMSHRPTHLINILHSRLAVSANSLQGPFSELQYLRMNFIFIARQHTDARYWYSKSVRLSVRYVPVSDENGLT